VFHDTSKDIEIIYHFIRDNIQKGAMKLQYTPTNQQVAEILTKPLSKGSLKHSETNLDWCKIPSSLRGSVEKCSSSRNFLHKVECECERSGSRHFISDHLGKVGNNHILQFHFKNKIKVKF
jgi:hypothetical protein